MKTKTKVKTKFSEKKEPESNSKNTYGEFPWDEFNAMLLADPTRRFCADYLKMSEDKIERHLRKEFDMTFNEYKSLKFDFTIWQIKQAVVSKAILGNIEAAKFVLSNKSDWTDKKEVSIEDVSDRELVEAVRAIAEKQAKNGT